MRPRDFQQAPVHLRVALARVGPVDGPVPSRRFSSVSHPVARHARRERVVITAVADAQSAFSCGAFGGAAADAAAGAGAAAAGARGAAGLAAGLGGGSRARLYPALVVALGEYHLVPRPLFLFGGRRCARRRIRGATARGGRRRWSRWRGAAALPPRAGAGAAAASRPRRRSRPPNETQAKQSRPTVLVRRLTNASAGLHVSQLGQRNNRPAERVRRLHVVGPRRAVPGGRLVGDPADLKLRGFASRAFPY